MVGALVFSLLLATLPALAAPLQGRVLGSMTPGSPWASEWRRVRQQWTTQHSLRFDYHLAERPESERPDSERRWLHDVRRGRAQITAVSMAELAELIPELSVLLAPYVFGSLSEADFVLGKPVADISAQLFAAQGLKLLGYQVFGWQGLCAADAIRYPAQLQGRRMVQPANRASRGYFAALGVRWIDPQQGWVAADLAECNQASTGLPAAFRRDSPLHYTSTDHSMVLGVVVANLDWFNAASRDQQAALVDVWRFPGADRRLEQRVAAKAMHNLTLGQLRAFFIAGQGVRAGLLDQFSGRSRELLKAVERGQTAYAAVRR